MDTMVLDLNLMSEIPKHVDGSKAAWLAQEMVKIPSLPGEEANLALFLADYLRGLGMEVQVQDVLASKQVIGRYRGSDGRPSLMFNGHMDHNPPILGWTKDPYGGIVEDGWLYGAGAVNMKGGDAAMITAAAAVHNSGIRLKGDLMVSCVMGELMGGLGTRHMLESGIVPDMAIVTEPSELEIGVRSLGIFQARINTVGRASHMGNPRGIHALEKMIRVLVALGPSHMPMKPEGWLKFKPHPEFPGFPQINAAAIEAGISRELIKWRPTLMPDFCTVLFECRFPPGVTEKSIEEDLNCLFEKLQAEDAELKIELETPITLKGLPLPNRPPFDMPSREQIIDVVSRYHESILGRRAPVGSARLGYATDANHFFGAGTKAVIYGPGGRYVNVPDERIRIEDIVQASKVLAMVAGDLCS